MVAQCFLLHSLDFCTVSRCFIATVRCIYRLFCSSSVIIYKAVTCCLLLLFYVSQCAVTAVLTPPCRVLIELLLSVTLKGPDGILFTCLFRNSLPSTLCRPNSTQDACRICQLTCMLKTSTATPLSSFSKCAAACAEKKGLLPGSQSKFLKANATSKGNTKQAESANASKPSACPQNYSSLKSTATVYPHCFLRATTSFAQSTCYCTLQRTLCSCSWRADLASFLAFVMSYPSRSRPFSRACNWPCISTSSTENALSEYQM